MTKFQFRTNWRGKLILQRLNTYRDQWGGPDRLWEDADAGDLKNYYAELCKLQAHCSCQQTREQFESECV